MLCIGHLFGQQPRPLDARPRPRSVQGGRCHHRSGYVLVLGGLLKGDSIGPLIRQFFPQILHGQARSTAATGKMFPRPVHLQLEVGFIFTLVISPAVTFATALDTRTAPHHPGRIINALDTRYTILIKTRLPRASSQKWKSVRVKCSIVPLRAIVRKRAAWILNHAADGTLRPAPKRFVSGETLPYLGRNVKSIVESADVRRPEVRFDHWRFRISVPRDLEGVDRYERIRRAVVEWYRVRAADRLRDNVNRWWHRLGNGAQQQILIREPAATLGELCL